jgi:hypothetical protein
VSALQAQESLSAVVGEPVDRTLKEILVELLKRPVRTSENALLRFVGGTASPLKRPAAAERQRTKTRALNARARRLPRKLSILIRTAATMTK